jgi:hypothetical protein
LLPKTLALFAWYPVVKCSLSLDLVVNQTGPVRVIVSIRTASINGSDGHAIALNAAEISKWTLIVRKLRVKRLSVKLNANAEAKKFIESMEPYLVD